MIYNGKKYEQFSSAFNDKEYTGRFVGSRIAPRIPHRNNKVTTLDRVMEVINDGDPDILPALLPHRRPRGWN